jgi:hypothetical protein
MEDSKYFSISLYVMVISYAGLYHSLAVAITCRLSNMRLLTRKLRTASMDADGVLT